MPFQDGKLHFVEERFYVCRIDSHEVGAHENVDEAERASISGNRWWSLAEIKMSSEAFAPLQLASLLEPILLGSYPDVPIEVAEGGGKYEPESGSN
jgi:hypothetical protein